MIKINIDSTKDICETEFEGTGLELAVALLSVIRVFMEPLPLEGKVALANVLTKEITDIRIPMWKDLREGEGDV